VLSRVMINSWGESILKPSEPTSDRLHSTIGGTDAKDYNVDTSRIVTSSESAGGHLALTTGMIPGSAGLDRQCPGINFQGRGAEVPKTPQS
jgi:hypothetical protein